MHLLLRAIAIAAVSLVSLGLADAQPSGADATAFPMRTIRIVVPFPAGGPSDVLARLIGRKMSEDWNQAVVIENRPGANTVIGAQVVAKAAPDGYTLLMAIDSTLAMNQYLYRNPPYDPLNDFAPITLVAKTMQLLIVNAASDVKTVQDLIAKAKTGPGVVNAASDVKTVQDQVAKAQGGKLNYGAGTITTKLTGYLFNKAAGIDSVLVPYNGSAEVTHGLLTRSVDFAFDGPSAAASLIESGQFRVLAKFDGRPFPLAPDAPNITTIVPGLDEIAVWLGLVAPKETPPAIVEKLAREVAKILVDPAIKGRADAAGLYPATDTPAEFAAFIRKEAERWSKVVAESGMKYD